MNDIQLYDNGIFSARTLHDDDDGQIWFVAKDVAIALGYSQESIETPGKLFGHVPEIWTDRKRILVSSANSIEQMREVLCLTEQGLYFFLGRSDKEKALPYQMWIAGEVVPSIRRTGSYSLRDGEKLTETIMYAARMIFDAAGIKDNQMALALDKVAKHYIGRSLLAMSGIELVAPNKCQLFTPTEIGKHFGISGRKVNKILCEEGYQQREGNSYIPLEAGEPFAVMLDTRRKHSDGTPVRQLKWEAYILDEVADLMGGVKF